MAQERWDAQGPMDEVIARLQELLLKAAALGQRLPGLQQPIILPTNCQLRSGSSHPILTDNLSPALDLHELPAVLRPMSAAEYRAEFPGGTDFRYLSFQPPDISPQRVRLVISAMRGRPGDDPPPYEVGNIQTEFHQHGGRWEAVSAPSLFISNGSHELKHNLPQG